MPERSPADRLNDIPHFIRMAEEEGKITPFYKAIENTMEPYKQALKAGHITPEQFNQIAAAAALEQTRQYVGGDIPEQKAAEEGANKQRAAALSSYGIPAEKEQAVIREAPPYYGDAYKLIDLWQKTAGPAAVKQAPPEATVTPTSMQGGSVGGTTGAVLSMPPTGPTAPGGPTAGFTPSAEEGSPDEHKLTESHLLLLQKLAGHTHV